MSSSCAVQLSHIYGYNPAVRHNLHVVNDSEILYVAGSVLVIYNVDKKSQRFIYTTTHSSTTAHSAASLATAHHAQNSSAEIACIAVGAVKPAGSNSKIQIVAVAERGTSSRSARVCIYDMATGKRRIKFPVNNPAQQSADILDLQFSADGRHVLVQGGAPDYMLSQIAWDKNKVVCSGGVGLQTGVVARSAYCTMDPTVIAVCGNNILRFLHIENGEFKVIPYSGSSVVSGSVTHYTCHLWIASMYILCSISGEISVYDNAEYKGIVQTSRHTALSIYAILATSKGFIVAGSNSKICVYEYDTQHSSQTSSTTAAPASTSYNNIFKLVRTMELPDKHQTILNLALSSSEDVLMCSTDNRQMYTVQVAATDNNMGSGAESTHTTITSLYTSHHTGSINGLCTSVSKPLLGTICHSDRTLCLWNYVNHTLELTVHLPDKPDCIAIHPSALHCIIGYADTVLCYDILIDTLKCVHTVHVKQCTAICYTHSGSMYLLAYGNTINLHNTYTNHCIHSYTIHHTPITYLRFTLDDHIFISASSDHSVLYTTVHNHHTQTLIKPKIDLLAQCVVDNVVYASTISNKLLLSNEMNTTNNACSYVEISTDTTSATPITCLQTLHSKATGVLLAGNSTGHLLLYSLPINHTCTTSTLHTHSGALHSIAVAPDNQHVFTVGADGVLCLYSVNLHDVLSPVKHKGALPAADACEFNDNVLIEAAALQHKRAMLAALEHQITDLYAHNEINIRQCEQETREALRHLTAQHHTAVSALRGQQHELSSTIHLVNQKYAAKIVQLSDLQRSKVSELQLHCSSKLSTEAERYRLLQEKVEQMAEQWRREYDRVEQSSERRKGEIGAEYVEQLLAGTAHTADLLAARDGMHSAVDSTRVTMEAYVDLEVSELKQSYESKLANERLITLRLRDQNSVLKRKFESLRQDIQSNLDQLSQCKSTEQSLHSRINALQYEIECLQKEITERHSTISEKQERVAELKKKNQELEKFKFVLDYKITELKKQIQPRTIELQNHTLQRATVHTQVHQLAQKYKLLQFDSHQLALKYTGAQHQYTQLQMDVEVAGQSYHAVAQHLYDLCHQQPTPTVKQYKAKIVELYQQCVQRPHIDIHALQPKSTLHQYQREVAHLHRSLQSMYSASHTATTHHSTNKSATRLQAERGTLQCQLQQAMQRLSQQIERRISEHTKTSKQPCTSKLVAEVQRNQQRIAELQQAANIKFDTQHAIQRDTEEKENI